MRAEDAMRGSHLTEECLFRRINKYLELSFVVDPSSNTEVINVTELPLPLREKVVVKLLPPLIKFR